MDRVRGYPAVSLAAGLLLFSIAPTTAAEVGVNASAQELGMLQVTVQVDGLSCPFCAYGLEKRLKKVENVADLSIQVDQERAVLTSLGIGSQPRQRTRWTQQEDMAFRGDESQGEPVVQGVGLVPRTAGFRGRTRCR